MAFAGDRILDLGNRVGGVGGGLGGVSGVSIRVGVRCIISSCLNRGIMIVGAVMASHTSVGVDRVASNVVCTSIC